MENEQLNKEIDEVYRKSFWINLFQAVAISCAVWIGLANLHDEDMPALGFLYAYVVLSIYPVMLFFYRVAKEFGGDPEQEKLRLRRVASVFWKEYNSETFQYVISKATEKIIEGVERLTMSPEHRETTLALCSALNAAVVHRVGHVSDELLLKILDLSLDEFQDLLEELEDDPKEKELVLLITDSLTPVLTVRSRIVKEEIHLLKTREMKEPTKEQIDASFNTPRFEERLIAFLRKIGQIKD